MFVSSFVESPRERPLLGRAHRQLLRFAHPYFELKRRMDARVTSAMRDGAPIALVRPTFCLGPWDIGDPEAAFIPLLVRGELPALTSHELNAIDVRDKRVGIILSGGNVDLKAIAGYFA